MVDSPSHASVFCLHSLPTFSLQFLLESPNLWLVVLPRTFFTRTHFLLVGQGNHTIFHQITLENPPGKGCYPVQSTGELFALGTDATEKTPSYSNGGSNFLEKTADTIDNTHPFYRPKSHTWQQCCLCRFVQADCRTSPAAVVAGTAVSWLCTRRCCRPIPTDVLCCRTTQYLKKEIQENLKYMKTSVTRGYFPSRKKTLDLFWSGVKFFQVQENSKYFSHQSAQNQSTLSTNSHVYLMEKILASKTSRIDSIHTSHCFRHFRGRRVNDTGTIAFLNTIETAIVSIRCQHGCQSLS